MPFALTTIGILLIITGFQNTYQQFGKQLVKDFSGDGNFFYWGLAIGIIGAIGYVKALEGFSRAFMALIIVTIFLNKQNQGFFNQLTTALSSGSNTPVKRIGAPLPQNTGAGNNGGKSSGLGDVISGGSAIDDLTGGIAGDFLDGIGGDVLDEGLGILGGFF